MERMRDEHGRIDIRWLSDACGGTISCKGEFPEQAVGELVIDSRVVKKGDIFVALRGENENGEKYCGAAFENGASAVICRRGAAEAPASGGVLIEVDDPLAAIQRAARASRLQGGYKVIGITGSVGKTTVKELCIGVLSRRYLTDGTRGNLNNALGLPLSILNAFGEKMMHDFAGKRYRGKERYLVLEMGISVPGEMELLADIARPDLAVITNIGDMHAQTLGDRDNTAREKLKIAAYGCHALLFDGDERIKRAACASYYRGVRFITVSHRLAEGEHALIKNVRHSDSVADGGFDLEYTDQNGKTLEFLRITAPFAGEHAINDSAYASLIGALCGVSNSEVIRGISLYRAEGMRQRLVRDGKIYRLIDCYNSGPASVTAALSALEIYAARYGCKRKVAVLGSMLELGEISESEHMKLGKQLCSRGIGLVFTVGDDAKWIVTGAREAGFPAENIVSYCSGDDFEKIREQIESNIFEGDIVLYKGSRGVGLERLIPIKGQGSLGFDGYG